MSETPSALIFDKEPNPARHVTSPSRRPQDGALEGHDAQSANRDEADACGVASLPPGDPPNWWSGR